MEALASQDTIKVLPTRFRDTPRVEKEEKQTTLQADRLPVSMNGIIQADRLSDEHEWSTVNGRDFF